jgi:hypothetical protein
VNLRDRDRKDLDPKAHVHRFYSPKALKGFLMVVAAAKLARTDWGCGPKAGFDATTHFVVLTGAGVI